MPWAAGASSAVAIIVLPLAAALACFVAPRAARAVALATAFAILLGVLMLAAQVSAEGALTYRVGGWGAPLGIDLYADGLTLFMLLAAALTSVGVCCYGLGHREPQSRQVVSFWPLWLIAWTALNALFLAGDVFNIYVTLELMGLAAVVLVATGGGTDALTAAMRYLLMTLVASMIYLLGVGLLYHQAATLDIALLGKTLEPTPGTWVALGLIIGALLLKSAVFPLHFWLPLAYARAPVPVSALLSALVSKATLYLLVRVWLDVMPAQPAAAGGALAGLGAAAIVWGSLQALRQTELRLLLAYSAVAQAGYLLLPFGFGDGPPAALAWQGATYFLLCYALAKAAMFLAAGNLFRAGECIGELRLTAVRSPLGVAAFGIAGVTLIGLPPSGGFLGKWLLVEAGFAAREWWLAAVVLGGGLLSAAYVFKVVGLAFTEEGGIAPERPPWGYLDWVPLVLAVTTLVLGFLAPTLLDLLAVGAPFGAASSGATLSGAVDPGAPLREPVR